MGKVSRNTLLPRRRPRVGGIGRRALLVPAQHRLRSQVGALRERAKLQRQHFLERLKEKETSNEALKQQQTSLKILLERKETQIEVLTNSLYFSSQTLAQMHANYQAQEGTSQSLIQKYGTLLALSERMIGFCETMAAGLKRKVTLPGTVGIKTEVEEREGGSNE
ncbi:hypothetical protein NUW58_g544 [Xylaria curta]|uniref:Uncharacterized protein n=1 Tax=Xylaria curta TaxID=42375 RepID=A0ACC1PQN6_9PEZI|nr:hypothetical protein NUW58_g544 [Xylaria curta]